MVKKPRIFISAVSSELGPARSLVAETLQFMGHEPEWQESFSTDSGDLREMLQRRIDNCDAVFQLIGFRYGAEPPTIEDDIWRVSYTQFEAIYAKQTGKPVWYFIADQSFPVLDAGKESDDAKDLQLKYRDLIESGTDLYCPVTGNSELEIRVLRMRDELVEIRKGLDRRLRVILFALALILLISCSVLAGQWLSLIHI